jgi:hypothetical protein
MLLPFYHLAPSATTPPPSYTAISAGMQLSDEKASATTSSGGGGGGGGGGLVVSDRPGGARWVIPLFTCRALSMAPALWWGLRCAFTFLGELLLGEVGVSPPAAAAATATTSTSTMDVEKRFRITEVFLAILWVS